MNCIPQQEVLCFSYCSGPDNAGSTSIAAVLQVFNFTCHVTVWRRQSWVHLRWIFLQQSTSTLMGLTHLPPTLCSASKDS